MDVSAPLGVVTASPVQAFQVFLPLTLDHR